MTCEECQQMLTDRSPTTGGERWRLSACRAGPVEAHIDNCRACATKRVELARLEGALDQLRVSRMHIEAPPSIEKKLLDAFRENRVQPRPAIRMAFPWRLVWVSLASLALAATTMVLYLEFKPDSLLKQETKGSSKELVMPWRVVPEVSSAAKRAIDQSRDVVAGNPRTEPRPRPRAVHKGTSEPSRVVRKAVPANDLLSLNGGGSIVRVTLPFSSLVAMGVPVRPDLWENRVTADVWMDPFGAVVGVRVIPAKPGGD